MTSIDVVCCQCVAIGFAAKTSANMIGEGLASVAKRTGVVLIGRATLGT